MAQVDVMVRARAIVGEGPVWQPETGVLHWVDIPQGTIFSSVPGSSASAGVQLPWSVGAVALERDGGLVFAGATGFGLITDDGYDLWLPFSRLELHLYNLRHIQHHTGQLSAYLRRVVPELAEPKKLRCVRSGW